MTRSGGFLLAGLFKINVIFMLFKVTDLSKSVLQLHITGNVLTLSPVFSC